MISLAVLVGIAWAGSGIILSLRVMTRWRNVDLEWVLDECIKILVYSAIGGPITAYLGHLTVPKREAG
ncbi:MAG: hypothetical protein DWQ40_00320 [Actinobacteria bacterium]|nr:MAG: hypothetical protein DWQ40_00320 [Actinomycetota bacterium]REK35585.1 MAG: hypothetical protein DWQ20_06065 [Actinomycetota bacterium]